MSNQILDREEILAKAKTLGIVHDKRAKSQSILKMIEDLTGESFSIKKAQEAKTEGFTKCIIHSNDRDNDEVEMTLAVLDGSKNERVLIQIGEEINLENKFITVLKDAVIDRSISILDDDGEPTGKTKMRKEPRYIMEVI